ncbi:MAG: hypothetical protein CME06_13365 [Gemmatimonadetes bacterium]|nr:hypothetical protein [Gemmatimonadota bacterium]
MSWKVAVRERLIPLLLLSLSLSTAALILLLVSRPGAKETDVQGLLATIKANIDLPAEARVLKAEQGEGELVMALISVAEDRLRIRVSEHLDRAEATELVQQSRAMIENLFMDRQAPYPGQLSHSLRCPDRFLPREIDSSDSALLMLRLFANDRLTFGGCSEDLLRYRATLAFFYDEPRKRLFRIDYFAAKENAVDPGIDVLRSFRIDSGREVG